MSTLSSLLFDEEGELDWILNPSEVCRKSVYYRRAAGKIGLTSKESGKRGAWVEKRVFIWKSLLQHGIMVVPGNTTTEQTTAEGIVYAPYTEHDLLMIEFAGTNLQFYGKDWEETCNIIRQHKGIVIFICDDPDLPFLWNLLPDEDYSRWMILANAINEDAIREVLKVPTSACIINFPMLSKPIDTIEFSKNSSNQVIYIGRNSGRTQYIKEFIKSPNLVIAGKASEWQDYPELKLIDIPDQKDRYKFYSKYAGCLSLYDKKHARTGWRTGRAYHALCSGIPVLAPKGNPGLNWCYETNVASDIERYLNTDKEVLWHEQYKTLLTDYSNFEGYINDISIL